MNSWSPLYNIAETTNSIYSQHKKYTIYEDTSKLKMANLFIKSHELFPEKLMKMSGKKKKTSCIAMLWKVRKIIPGSSILSRSVPKVNEIYSRRRPKFYKILFNTFCVILLKTQPANKQTKGYRGKHHLHGRVHNSKHLVSKSFYFSCFHGSGVSVKRFSLDKGVARLEFIIFATFL